MLSASWDQGRKMVSLISSAVFKKHKVKVGVDCFFSRASDNSASSHWSSYTDVVIQTWFQTIMVTTGGAICPFPIGPNVELADTLKFSKMLVFGYILISRLYTIPSNLNFKARCKDFSLIHAIFFLKNPNHLTNTKCQFNAFDCYYKATVPLGDIRNKMFSWQDR